MKHLILILSILTLYSCNKSNKPSYEKKKISSEALEGKKLMENNCYVCHNPTAKHSDRIAPPMIAIKKHYISNQTNKAAFIASMQNWILNPTLENSKMKGAVKRFGLMPKQHFPEETIKQIAIYMFENEIEQPEWFEEHYNEERGKGKNTQSNKEVSNIHNLTDAERGLKYALATKVVLGKNLMSKIQKEGTIAALNFCNIKAYPLTDSMAILQKATIKRISDKPRNSNNKANLEELKYIDIFKQNVLNNIESNPIVIKDLENVNVYYPIKTNSMCLQCHGTPNTDIKPATLTEIDKFYPKDLATGYKTNQVRGIWHVSYQNK